MEQVLEQCSSKDVILEEQLLLKCSKGVILEEQVLVVFWFEGCHLGGAGFG